jgi:hypothetical protein
MGLEADLECDPFKIPGTRAAPEIPRMLFLRNSRRLLFPMVYKLDLLRIDIDYKIMKFP